MPLATPTLTAVILPNLVATGALGVGTPTLALGLASGVVQWASTAQVRVEAAGTAGVGLVSAPPAPVSLALYAAMLASFSGQGILGIAAPTTALGISNGICTGLLQGLLTVPVFGVGAGAGVAHIQGVGAPPMVQGFAMAGMTNSGSVRLATAVGLALDTYFAAFTQPVAVAGPPSPSPGATVAFGQLL